MLAIGERGRKKDSMEETCLAFTDSFCFVQGRLQQNDELGYSERGERNANCVNYRIISSPVRGLF